jgi:pimeloyl-ACP methyl ester carboxylesterase
MSAAVGTSLQRISLDGRTITYRELGEGPPVLLLHGWPTSSYLWRGVMPPMAVANRVIAVDLPGFGGSDKPADAVYDFAFFRDAIDGFLESVNVGEHGLAVHDLGGPVGVDWALERPGRVTKLALLNTLVYPEFSEEVIDFVRQLASPELRGNLTSPEGLEGVMRLGTVEGTLTPEAVAGYVGPFASDDDRRALARAGIGLELERFVELGKRLPELRDIPVRIVYGERDPILPDVADTMARIKRDLPQADIATLPDASHFLQEDAPEEVGQLLARFFAA